MNQERLDVMTMLGGRETGDQNYLFFAVGKGLNVFACLFFDPFSCFDVDIIFCE